MWSELSIPWRVCVEQAWIAYRAGSMPIGAAIVDADGQVIAAGRNARADHADTGDTPISGHTLAHAEINALLSLGFPTPDGGRYVLYTTTEPCPLCVGAIAMCNVPRVRYASRDPWAGCAALLATDSYLGRKGIQANAPDHPLLEGILVAMHTDAVLRLPSLRRRNELLATCRGVIPRGVALGEALHRSGELAQMRAAGVDAGTVVGQLAEMYVTS